MSEPQVIDETPASKPDAGIPQNLQTLPDELVPFVYDYTNDRVKLLLASIQRLESRQIPLVALSGVLLKIGFDLPACRLRIACQLASGLALGIGAIGLTYAAKVDVTLPKTLIKPDYTTDGEAFLKKIVLRQWLEETEPQALQVIQFKGWLLNGSIGLSILSGLIYTIAAF